MDLARRVLYRHLTAAGAPRYEPPKSVAVAVREGRLPFEVLDIWAYVVDQLGGHFEYGTAVKYWRNKCAKMGVILPPEYLKGLGGEGSGNWKVLGTETVEEWVRAKMASEAHIDEFGRTLYQWTAWMNHWRRASDEALERVRKHREALKKGEGGGKAPDAKRLKWLQKAEADFAKFNAEFMRANDGFNALFAQIERHRDHRAPIVAFEVEFQAMVEQLMRTVSKTDVLKAVERTINRVNEGLAAPDPSMHTALDLGGIWKSVVDALSYAYDLFSDWLGSVLGWTEKLETMMDKAGASPA
jgi:hypothetical protein